MDQNILNTPDDVSKECLKNYPSDNGDTCNKILNDDDKRLKKVSFQNPNHNSKSLNIPL